MKNKKPLGILVLASLTFIVISGINNLNVNTPINDSFNPINEYLPEIDLKISAPLDKRTGYAIVVGISNYPGSDNDLEYCDDDAQDVMSMLIDDYNFKSENIIYLQDSAATRNAISTAFDEIAANITSDDVFYFYYSGHGGAVTVDEGPFLKSISSPHYYSNNMNSYWSIYHADAAYMRVHFTRLETETSYDYVLLGDTDLYTDDYYYYAYDGTYGSGLTSGWVPLLSDNKLWINLYTDISNTRWGFDIDYYEVKTYNGTEYLCPYDSLSTPSNSYYDYLLDSKLDAINCEEKYIISDSCNSGGMISEAQNSGRYIITACNDDEYSLEDSARGNGVFTYYLLRASDYATDSNGDGVISMEESYAYCYSNTVSRSNFLGSIHHPQQYDGITGSSILQPSITNIEFQSSGTNLSYSFNMHGTGEIKNITLIMNYINDTNEIEQKTINITSSAPTATGFGTYNSIADSSGLAGINGIYIIVSMEGNELLTLNETKSIDSDGDSIGDLLELSLGTNYQSADTDSDGLNDYLEIYIYSSNALDPDSDDDGLIDGLEVFYGSNVWISDTDGDGILDGMEVSFGLDPINPRSTFTTIFVNIGGFVLLIVSGLISSRIIIKKSKDFKSKKVKIDFKIKGTPESRNGLDVKTKYRPIPIYKSSYGYGYQRPLYGSTSFNTRPSYQQSTPTTNFAPATRLAPNQMKNFVSDIVQNKIPPPTSIDSTEGKKAMAIALSAVAYLERKNIKESVNYIIKALRMGVPEPYNSQFKGLILKMGGFNTGSPINTFNNQKTSKIGTNMIDNQSFGQIKSCSSCGYSSNIDDKFCIKCGRMI